MTRKFRFTAILLAASVIIAAVFIAGCDEQQESASKKQGQQTARKEEKKIATQPKKVKLATSLGDIVIELNEKAAPGTVKNFLRYTEEGFYDGTIFHRVIKGFMIQCGGFTSDMNQKQTHAPIENEAANGLKNDKGTIAMARTANPDSATSQFFINHKNNDSLNYIQDRNPGYAVFGKVVEGMDIVDKIAAVKTARKSRYSDVPVTPVVIKSAKVLAGK